MKGFVTLLAVTCLILGGTLRAAETDPQKEAAVRKLMEVTGMTRLVDQMMDQMITGMQSSAKELPPAFFEIFKRKAKASDLMELIIPIYEKHYSLEELNGLTAFYQTPLGKKVLQTMPQVMQEAMQAGQQWGARLGREAAEEAAGKAK